MDTAQPVASARAQWATLVRDHAPEIAVAIIACGFAAYFTAAGLLLHWSFNSYGWDLGIFDQLLWNTTHGHPFEYSFREFNYLGDHFQPVLLLLTPLAYLGVGPAPLLVVQGLAFGAAVAPLYAATRRLAGTTAAVLMAGAYVLSLFVARAVAYDFHPESFIPLLAFTSLWGMVSGKRVLFVGAALALLLLKEDAALLILGLCWVAWLAFGLKREAAWTAGIAVAYTAVISLIVMPLVLGDDSNPLLERYGYLGDSSREIALNLVIRPDLVVDHLERWAQWESVLVLLAGVGFLPLLQPKLLPPLAVLIVVPLLAEHGQQSLLELHYGVAPGTFALVVAAVALRDVARWSKRLPGRAGEGAGRPYAGSLASVAAAVVLMAAIGVWAWKSPLPPSFAAESGRFEVDHHADVAQSFVEMVPEGIPVSAQATYVPHLSQRRHIYEFPRILDSRWVLLDEKRPVPGYDWPTYEACRAELPELGFEVVRSEDGVTLWERVGEAEVSGETACG